MTETINDYSFVVPCTLINKTDILTWKIMLIPIKRNEMYLMFEIEGKLCKFTVHKKRIKLWIVFFPCVIKNEVHIYCLDIGLNNYISICIIPCCVSIAFINFRALIFLLKFIQTSMDL